MTHKQQVADWLQQLEATADDAAARLEVLREAVHWVENLLEEARAGADAAITSRIEMCWQALVRLC